MESDWDDTVRVDRAVVVRPTVDDGEDTILVERFQLPGSRGAPTEKSISQPIQLDSGEIAAEKPTPMYYSFRVGLRSPPIMLNAPCYVGRRPSPPRVSMGHPLKLLRVPSPLKEVSSTHLEVKQVGASVVVTDWKSTNGSIVMVPGSVPRKLRQGESVVVTPGTLVDIGDENILQILPMQRPA